MLSGVLAAARSVSRTLHRAAPCFHSCSFGPLQTFSLHIGADLKLPTPDSQRHSRFEAAPAAMPQAQAASDPFEGLPFRAMAERMGEAMSPVVQAVSTSCSLLLSVSSRCRLSLVAAIA